MQSSEFFNLWDVFRNELIGSTWLFIFLGFIVICYVGVRYFKLPFSATVVLGVLFLAIVGASETTGVPALWGLIVLGVGIFWAVIFHRWFFRR